MSERIDVLAVMQEFAIANGSLEMGAARQAVAEQQRILRQLATWNRNPNGDGDELSALCAAAEMLAGKASDDAPKFDVATLPAVAELVEADKEYDAARNAVCKAAQTRGRHSSEAVSARHKLGNAIARRAAALARIAPNELHDKAAELRGRSDA